MILQGLVDYYERKSADPSSALAPFRWDELPIPWLALFTEDGEFFSFQSTEQGSGKSRQYKTFMVPILGEKKGAGIKSNRFWENIEYMFGIPVPTQGKPNPDPLRVARQHEEFLARILEVKASSRGLIAIQNFFSKRDYAGVMASENWKEVLRDNRSVLLGIIGKGPITDDPEVRRAVNALMGASDSGGICLVTGQRSSIARLEPPLRGVRGTDARAERALVSFNLDSFKSYGKEKNFNAPVSELAGDAYAKALNHLMRRESKNNARVGDTTVLFWSEEPTQLESDFCYFWVDDKDDPDRDIRAVMTLLDAPLTGAAVPESDTRFYVLGLAPNSTRIAVCFSHIASIDELSRTIQQHFRDLEIVLPKGDRGSCALYRLAQDIAPENDIDKIPRSLVANVMRAALSGGPYPATLLQQAVRRIRAAKKETVTRPQAALLKAYLNRRDRFRLGPRKEEIQVSLDPTNINPGYRLGRLFAVLEKIQEDAQQNINATIRDRYYGAASSNPITVFPQLLKLKNHHLAKIENPSFRIAHEKRLSEIFAGLAPDMPRHLSMEDQARFAVGYYHQRQALFAKSTTNQETKTEGTH